MKNIRFLTFVLTLGALLLSACAATASKAAPAAISANQNGDVMPVSFVGIVDSMAGDQWVISGTTMTVDPSIVRDGPFKVGDHIKVEGFVKPDGSVTVSRVETPSGQAALTATPFAVDNSNDVNENINDDNSNSLNSNDDNGNDTNINDDNSNSLNSNDDNGNTANSNDDNGGSGKSKDDKGGSNSNDDKGGSGGGKSSDDNGNGG